MILFLFICFFCPSCCHLRKIPSFPTRRFSDLQQHLSDYQLRLAKSLASVINILDPYVIVLGGGMSNIESLYQTVPCLWLDYVFSDSVQTKLVSPQFGDSSGVRGAAWLWPSY